MADFVSCKRESVVVAHHVHVVYSVVCVLPVPTVQQDCHMVVPVQEDQWPLAQYDEHSVDQLWCL
jgi:hypothetical protein